jgi:peptidyl-prolyl cis-trans isomerase B (cyclophilin B)
MRRVHWSILLACCLLLVLGALSACGAASADDEEAPAEGREAPATAPKPGAEGEGDASADIAPSPDLVEKPADKPGPPDPNHAIGEYADPHAVITVDGGGQIVIKLEKDKTPKTVENFIRLAEQKFYDGTVFHRVLPTFMAQGGSPDGQGRNGPGWTIDLEIDPSLRNVRGAISMARKRDPNSAGSQFFIVLKDKSYLDDQYAVFGKVVDGMDVVESLKKGSTNPAEHSRYGMSGPEDGWPSAMETVVIVDGKPE